MNAHEIPSDADSGALEIPQGFPPELLADGASTMIDPIEVDEVSAGSPGGLYLFTTESGASYMLALLADGSTWMSRTAGPEDTVWGSPARYRDGEAMPVRIEHLAIGSRAVLWFVKAERYGDPLYVGTRRETTPVQRIEFVVAETFRRVPDLPTVEGTTDAVDG